jgi:beta-galactosidase/beta-glucuronidase
MAGSLTGRSLWNVAPVGGQWERDVVAFRDLNVNWIRTSHYPPAEELMEAADELGMLIELEMPLCWDKSSTTAAGFAYTVQVHMEAVQFNRHHASVIAWSR